MVLLYNFQGPQPADVFSNEEQRLMYMMHNVSSETVSAIPLLRM